MQQPTQGGVRSLVKVPAETLAGVTSRGSTSRLTWDPVKERLDTALGVRGIAWYDISDELQPAVVATHFFGDNAANPTSNPDLVEHPELLRGSTLQVMPVPDDTVFVTLLDGGVAVLEAGSPQASAGPLRDVHLTRFQANALWPVDPPQSPDGSLFWLADGRGGVHEVAFSDFQ